MILTLDPENPEPWLLQKAIKQLRPGTIFAYPTDTVYGLGCDVSDNEAIARIYNLKKMDPRKPLSLICTDLKMIGEYTAGIPNWGFRMMRKTLPGPYTYILKGSRAVPKKVLSQRKTVGVRIPENPIALGIVESLGRPILSISLKEEDGSYFTSAEDIERYYFNRIDIIFDGGYCYPVPSTIIDFTGDEPNVIREGKGPVELFQ
jgi:tRNA threonylcarbamoyl adenosine modification protein (Sua5/YciO/YrdC/YwlC family)